MATNLEFKLKKSSVVLHQNTNTKPSSSIAVNSKSTLEVHEGSGDVKMGPSDTLLDELLQEATSLNAACVAQGGVLEISRSGLQTLGFSLMQRKLPQIFVNLGSGGN